MSPQPVIARLVPGNPVIKPFGVAELLLSRLRRGYAGHRINNVSDYHRCGF
ncbi:hypothetical protein [Candidatus Spongiihabitans sp.]|uniref:hypothetical protein n=1 Tax=Candidatus Spongiihabitans sp. TaxID=3101308 RepID=UPI003C79E545